MEALETESSYEFVMPFKSMVSIETFGFLQ